MSNRIAEFFETVGHDIKVGAVDVEKAVAFVITKLFGSQALTQLETTAETMLKSDLGQAVLSDAEVLLAQVKSGQINQVSAITSLARSLVSNAKQTGVQLEESVATALASLAIGKLSGVLNQPAPATSAAVAAVTEQPAAPAADPATAASEAKTDAPASAA